MEYWGRATLPPRENLALEEYFFRRPAETKKPLLRFFDFPQDGIILGYAQAPDVLKIPVPAVRRLTGGSHVQVGQNTIAYTFAFPRDGTFTHYEQMRAHCADIVAGALSDLGLSPGIDNRASTITLNERVVASHAVIWGVESALLHGLLVLSPYDIDRLIERVFLQTRTIGNEQFTEQSALAQIPALSLELQTHPDRLKSLVQDAILKRATGRTYEKHIVDEQLLAHARSIQQQKYAGEAWTLERTPVLSPRDVETIPGEQLSGPLKKGLGYCFYSQVPDHDFKKMASPSDE